MLKNVVVVFVVSFLQGQVSKVPSFSFYLPNSHIILKLNTSELNFNSHLKLVLKSGSKNEKDICIYKKKIKTIFKDVG